MHPVFRSRLAGEGAGKAGRFVEYLHVGWAFGLVFFPVGLKLCLAGLFWFPELLRETSARCAQSLRYSQSGLLATDAAWDRANSHRGRVDAPEPRWRGRVKSQLWLARDEDAGGPAKPVGVTSAPH